jgi:hypothetical protein
MAAGTADVLRFLVAFLSSSNKMPRLLSFTYSPIHYSSYHSTLCSFELPSASLNKQYLNKYHRFLKWRAISSPVERLLSPLKGRLILLPPALAIAVYAR